eukprot:14788-Hanusia_phi.AAC.1
MSLMINDLGSQLSFMNPHGNIYNLKMIEEGRKKMWSREDRNREHCLNGWLETLHQHGNGTNCALDFNGGGGGGRGAKDFSRKVGREAEAENGDEAGAQAEATGSPRCNSNGQRQAATKETRQVKSREENELRSRLERIEKKLDK